MITLVILPNQMFDIKYYPDNIKKYIIWEHPHYFKSYNYNKKKLILHRASMKCYYNYLKSRELSVKYINFYAEFSEKNYVLFDPIDNINLPNNYQILESPNYLLTTNQLEMYQNKTDKYIFYNFYMWSKQQLNIIPTVKSLDKENRNRMPDNLEIPSIPTNKNDAEYICSAIKYIEKHFPKNLGNSDNFIYPISKYTAKKWLKDFIINKLPTFGDYQDFINTENNYMFHSLLSSSINIGLINPSEIIIELEKIQKKIPMNSYEGYIRQLFWREYQRYCYIYIDFKKYNYFGNKKKISQKWYDGRLGIEPVDNAIKRGFDTGYLHHIERLMVIGNYMNLSEISPNEGFKWFMEFSCDSYEWVMHQNVLDMVFFVTGGLTMRRPYISSSNYVLKMSNYKKDEWCEIWNELYKKFVTKHKNKLIKYRYYIKFPK